jgi:hypothetical protein
MHMDIGGSFLEKNGVPGVESWIRPTLGIKRKIVYWYVS